MIIVRVSTADYMLVLFIVSVTIPRCRSTVVV